MIDQRFRTPLDLARQPYRWPVLQLGLLRIALDRYLQQRSIS